MYLLLQLEWMAGTDVNFGEISRKLIHWLGNVENCSFHTSNRVIDLNRCSSGWELAIKNLKTGVIRKQTSSLYLLVQGGSILLLQKAGVPEIQGYGGFPIGGQWLVCDNQEIVKQHDAKVYGLSPVSCTYWQLLTWIVDGWKVEKLCFLVLMLHGQLSFCIVVVVFSIYPAQLNIIIY